MPRDRPKGPLAIKFCINSFTQQHTTQGTFGEHTHTHKYRHIHIQTHTQAHTPVGVYSPNEGDHLLHYVPAEGDDHKQFLNVHFDDCFSNECCTKKSPERD